MNITANIPDALYQQFKALAQRQNISVEQLITIALSAQVSAWMTKDYHEYPKYSWLYCILTGW
jgi:hypothetical protein